MPKLNDRDKLAQQDATLKRLQAEIADTQKRVRAHYAEILHELPVEHLTDREFKDLIGHAVRAGGGASIVALQVLPGIS